METPRHRPLIDLYRQGGLEDGWWQRLFLLGPLHEGTPEWEDAYAVARETMTRARRNIEMIVEYLRERRFEFGWFKPDGDLTPHSPWTTPTTEDSQALEDLSGRIGPLPLSLRAWWEIVGEVSLSGRFQEDSEHVLSDPLQVSPISYVLWDLSEWENNDEREGPFEAPISADVYHKANYSGGAGYAIELPDARADAPLKYVVLLVPGPPGALPSRVEINETFVEYLRRSFRWAGFPGYATLDDPTARRNIERLTPLFDRMIRI